MSQSLISNNVMVVISHDVDFLLAIGVTVNYGIKMNVNKAGQNEFVSIPCAHEFSHSALNVAFLKGTE